MPASLRRALRCDELASKSRASPSTNFLRDDERQKIPQPTSVGKKTFPLPRLPTRLSRPAVAAPVGIAKLAVAAEKVFRAVASTYAATAWGCTSSATGSVDQGEMQSRRAFQDITNNVGGSASEAPTHLGKKPRKSDRKADEIDTRDAKNPQACTDYVNDMYSHFRVKEDGKLRVHPTYMPAQPHINQKMRAILIDWLVEVHLKFKLVPETLYLTVNVIDRYLKTTVVERSNLQLVGVSALLLASKYEEIYPPELKDLVYITDKAYTQEQILVMEETMVKALQYNMTVSSIHLFLMRYLKAGHADRRMVWLASYICERMLQEYDMLKHLPSVIASCAVYIARKNLNRNSWSPTLVHYTQYEPSDLRGCLEDMAAILLSRTLSLSAVKKKYNSDKYGRVSQEHLTILD